MSLKYKAETTGLKYSTEDAQGSLFKQAWAVGFPPWLPAGLFSDENSLVPGQWVSGTVWALGLRPCSPPRPRGSARAHPHPHPRPKPLPQEGTAGLGPLAAPPHATRGRKAGTLASPQVQLPLLVTGRATSIWELCF